MGKKRSIPEGARFGNYFIITEKVNGKKTYKIRRRVILPNGQKLEPRYPLKHYKHLTTFEEFNKLVNRLNHRKEISSFALHL